MGAFDQRSYASVSLFFLKGYSFSEAVINSARCYLRHIRPPPFLLLPLFVLSCLSGGVAE